MTKAELAKKIYDIAHLTGEFKLRSGQISNEYFDQIPFRSPTDSFKRNRETHGPVDPCWDRVLAGLEMGGIPVATALSLETGIPCVFVRKEAKEYGTCQFAEGLDIKGKKVCIIEDVTSQPVASGSFHGGPSLFGSPDFPCPGRDPTWTQLSQNPS